MRRIGLFLLALGLGSLVVTAQDDADQDLKQRIKQLEEILNRRAKRPPAPQDRFLIGRAYDVSDLSAHLGNELLEPSNLLPSKYSRPEMEGVEGRQEYEVDQLIELIRTTVEPETWDEIAGASIEARNTRLFVTTVGGVHAGIARLLATLRAEVRQVVVDLVAVPLTREAAALLAERPRELSDKEALSLLQAEPLGTLRLVCADGQVQVQRNGRKTGYVRDYDVEVAEGAAIGRPFRGTIFEGFAAEVRAGLDLGGNGVSLSLRIERTKPGNPMRRVMTQHGPLDAPEMELTRIGTALWVPFQKTVILGGATAGAQPCVFLVTARLVR